MRTRVLLLLPTALDTRLASEHGQLTYVFDAPHSHPPVFSHGFDRAVAARLAALEYDPDADLLLIAGPVVALVRLTSAVMLRHGRMRALVWDAKARAYAEIAVGELVH